MFTIIGGDGKEYGPVSTDDLRKWIVEGRLNAQSLAKAEGDAEYRPLAAFPEFAGALAPQAHSPGAPPAFPAAAGVAAGDYELDIGGCLGRGWNLFKDNMGTLFGSFLVAMLILAAVGGVLNLTVLGLMPKAWLTSVAFKLGYNVVFQAVMAVVNGPLFGGLFYIFLQRLRGQPAGVGDLFIGFQRAFAQLYLGHFVVAFLVGLCFVPFNVLETARIEPLLEQMRQGSSATQNALPQLWPAIFGLLPVALLCMIPMVYLTVNWQFTLPLIIDKSMNFWPAMKTSWKRVHLHWWHVFGLTVVIGLINVAGLLACCIGVLFTIPMTTAGMMYAYETIFGESQAG